MPKQKNSRISIKQVMIDKSNSRMVLIAGIAAFITVFSLVAVKSLASQLQYQNKVIAAKKETLNVLKSNLTARDSLVKSYQNFTKPETNVIGGSSAGTGGNNGDNAKIITDALPFQYDFPAMATSLEKIVSTRNADPASTGSIAINSIVGVDDALQQAVNEASASPQSVPMPFDMQVTGKYDDLQKLILDFQNSIRPFVITKIAYSSAGSSDAGGDVLMSFTAQSFYQPSKELKITKEVVK